MLSTNPEWFGHNPHNQSVFEIHISLPLVCCCHCWWMKYSADNVRIQLHLHQQQTTSPLTVVTENWTQPILFNSIANAFQMNKAKRLIVHFRSIDRYCKSDSHLFPLPRIAHVKRTEFNAFAHFICMLMAGVQLEWAILAQNKLFLGCCFFSARTTRIYSGMSIVWARFIRICTSSTCIQQAFRNRLAAVVLICFHRFHRFVHSLEIVYCCGIRLNEYRKLLFRANQQYWPIPWRFEIVFYVYVEVNYNWFRFFFYIFQL